MDEHRVHDTSDRQRTRTLVWLLESDTGSLVAGYWVLSLSMTCWRGQWRLLAVTNKRINSLEQCCQQVQVFVNLASG